MSALSIQVQRQMRASLETLAHELGEHGSRAYLDEDARTCVIHGIDLFNETNRVGDLFDKQLPYLFHILRVRRRLRV